MPYSFALMLLVLERLKKGQLLIAFGILRITHSEAQCTPCLWLFSYDWTVAVRGKFFFNCLFVFAASLVINIPLALVP